MRAETKRTSGYGTQLDQSCATHERARRRVTVTFLVALLLTGLMTAGSVALAGGHLGVLAVLQR